MRIGIDSYSYHRLLGEVRPGETPPARVFGRGSYDVLAAAQALGVDGVSLETCFLDPPERLDAASLRAAAGSLEVALAWGHPHGLEFGRSVEALDDVLAWIDLAPAVGATAVRLVAASTRFRGIEPVDRQIEQTAGPLAMACRRAREVGVALAIENHGDLTAADITRLVRLVDDPVLGVCFDTANALRVGDDPLVAAARLAPLVRMVHLKDCEPLTPDLDPVAGPCSVVYGEGVVPVAAILDVLWDSGFQGLVCVEIGQVAAGADEQSLVESCVSWLRGYASSKG